MQGPTNRYDSLREQFSAEHKIEIEQTKRAILQIGFGTLKKYAIAITIMSVLQAIVIIF